jgi:hypothetical protein
MKLNKEILIIVIIVVSTILNKYCELERVLQFKITFFSLASVLFIYAIFDTIRKKTIINILISLLFGLYLFGSILGYNLNTAFYPESLIIICLGILSLLIRKRWLNH